jgi:hypothetical protein
MRASASLRLDDEVGPRADRAGTAAPRTRHAMTPWVPRRAADRAARPPRAARNKAAARSPMRRAAPAWQKRT